ncbi:ADP-ribosylglycohydrolase family protein [Streptomyces sp. EWL5.16]|uniref:ADP-ribosylglycohydrolase family protein n=2 Tax=unclassified Streptomyces TaxID=2593676 RepID=UPI0040430D30
MASIVRTPPAPASDGAAGLRDRARGALLGLAVGDALGAPAENLRPSEIRARWGRITGYVTDSPCGTDDTEYAIFSGLLLARHGSALTAAQAEAAWHEWIAGRAEGPFRGAGFSERGTLENLRRGLAAPVSAQHRHAWSDGLAMRAAPFGVFAAGRPAEAARLVAIDGSVSHEGEGIYGGQAVAAGVATAMTGAPVAVVIAAALAVIPEDSWTARSLRRAVAVSHRGERALRSTVVIGGYPWTDLAPEAVALAFGAYAAADGDFGEAVLTAVNMGRDADTTAAVAGALAGAAQGTAAIPAPWAAAIGPARGRCLPSMAGHHVLDVADLLVPGGGEARDLPVPGGDEARGAGVVRGARVVLRAVLPGEVAPAEAVMPAEGAALAEVVTPAEGVALAEVVTPAEGVALAEVVTPAEGVALAEVVTPAEGVALAKGDVPADAVVPVEVAQLPEGAVLPQGALLPEETVLSKAAVLPEGMGLPKRVGAVAPARPPDGREASPVGPDAVLPDGARAGMPLTAASQPAEPPPLPTAPSEPAQPSSLTAASAPTQPPPFTTAPNPAEPPPPLTTAPEPAEPPPPLTPAPHPAEPASRAGGRGRGPLVGAGNGGHPEGEGQS